VLRHGWLRAHVLVALTLAVVVVALTDGSAFAWLLAAGVAGGVVAVDAISAGAERRR